MGKWGRWGGEGHRGEYRESGVYAQGTRGGVQSEVFVGGICGRGGDFGEWGVRSEVDCLEDVVNAIFSGRTLMIDDGIESQVC